MRLPLTFWLTVASLEAVIFLAVSVAGQQNSTLCTRRDSDGVNRVVSNVQEAVGVAPGMFDLANVGPPPAPVCGNGVLEAGEGCDDGNNDDNDTCVQCCHTKEEVTLLSVGLTRENQTVLHVKVGHGADLELIDECKPLGLHRNFRLHGGLLTTPGPMPPRPFPRPFSNDYLFLSLLGSVFNDFFPGLKRIMSGIPFIERQFEQALDAKVNGMVLRFRLLRRGAVPVVWFSLECCVAEPVPTNRGLMARNVWKKFVFKVECLPRPPKKAFNAANREEMLCALGACVKKAILLQRNACAQIKHKHTAIIDVPSSL